MTNHCILGREHCRGDVCATCGWNRLVYRRRIEAIRAGGLQKDKKTGTVLPENQEGGRTMPGSVYGYARVSSRDQNEARQLIALEKAGVPTKNIYTDKQSGKDFDRPQYKKLVRKLKKGDVLFVESLDRLGRNYEEIQNQWRTLSKLKGVDIVVIDMPLLDTRQSRDLVGTLISDIVLQLLAYVAESERRSIKQRQAEGIAAAKARGVQFGRPPRSLPENFHEAVEAWRNKEIPLKQAAAMCGMATSTFYERAKREGAT